MNDEQLIWQNYQQIVLKEDFELREIEVLNRFLRTFHSEGRVVLTNKETIENTNIKQVPRDSSYNPKPKGIWYSLANEWAEYIKYDAPDWASDYTNVFLLDIDFSKILKIDTSEKLLSFNRKYANNMFVDWAALQEEGYCGVEIIPYQGSHRHSIPWYYGWDIASGCIWNSSCIKKVNKVYPRTKGNNTNKPISSSNTEISHKPHEHKSHAHGAYHHR